MVRRNGKKRGRDTVGGSHTNYLRKRFFEYQLGFGPQSLDRGAAPFLGKGINFVTCQVKSSGRTATLVEPLPRSITDLPPRFLLFLLLLLLFSSLRSNRNLRIEISLIEL